jgi:hypothetical protein
MVPRHDARDKHAADSRPCPSGPPARRTPTWLLLLPGCCVSCLPFCFFLSESREQVSRPLEVQVCACVCSVMDVCVPVRCFAPSKERATSLKGSEPRGRSPVAAVARLSNSRSFSPSLGIADRSHSIHLVPGRKRARCLSPTRREGRLELHTTTSDRASSSRQGRRGLRSLEGRPPSSLRRRRSLVRRSPRVPTSVAGVRRSAKRGHLPFPPKLPPSLPVNPYSSNDQPSEPSLHPSRTID